MKQFSFMLDKYTQFFKINLVLSYHFFTTNTLYLGLYK
jgi:hypothetical protein